jgi:hypothetical protein
MDSVILKMESATTPKAATPMKTSSSAFARADFATHPCVFRDSADESIASLPSSVNPTVNRALKEIVCSHMETNFISFQENI